MCSESYILIYTIMLPQKLDFQLQSKTILAELLLKSSLITYLDLLYSMFTNSKPVTLLSLRRGVPLNHIKVRGLKIFMFSEYLFSVILWSRYIFGTYEIFSYTYFCAGCSNLRSWLKIHGSMLLLTKGYKKKLKSIISTE